MRSLGRRRIEIINCRLNLQLNEASVSGYCWRDIEVAQQPRNNHLLEDARIGPDFHLPPQVSALRVNPGVLRNVTLTQQKIEISDRHLRIEHTADNEHGRGWLPQQA